MSSLASKSPTQERKQPPSEQLLHLLVKGATEYGLILISPKEEIIYWNKGAELLFGYSESEILGKEIYTLFTPEDIELGVAHKEIAKARDEGWAEDERWHLRKDNSRFWANGVVTCLKDGSGNVIGYSKVLRDQTLRKNTEDHIKSTNEQLRHFTSVAAHDLQEPVRMVGSYLALIEREYLGKIGGNFDEYLQMARRGTDHLRGLLNDLLNYARMDQGVKFENTDVSAVFDMAVSNLQVPITENDAIVTRTSLPPVRGNSTQLVQLFQNLIGNSIKYRKRSERPQVYADVAPKGNEWIFSVADNGIGIPADNRESVFEAFRRLHSKDEYPGSGLGLFICKRVVEAHGGKIWIESQPEHGTKVFFSLPRMEGDRS